MTHADKSIRFGGLDWRISADRRRHNNTNTHAFTLWFQKNFYPLNHTYVNFVMIQAALTDINVNAAISGLKLRLRDIDHAITSLEAVAQRVLAEQCDHAGRALVPRTGLAYCGRAVTRVASALSSHPKSANFPVVSILATLAAPADTLWR